MTRISPAGSNRSQSSWLVATNQMWKLYVALLGFGGTLFCFLAGGYLLVAGARYFGALVVGGTALGMITFVWLLNVLRCPSCQAKLVWTMLSTRSHTSWLVDLAYLESCPSCHSLLSRLGPHFRSFRKLSDR